ncbi:MAG: type I-E CRISPR-associated protein Cas6/Cse3/CasE [Lentisphaeria bacterium]|jgi:CRISPR system Cascade subunit CasE
MSFLTQGFLDFAAAARLKLRDLYDWHQLVWQAFPGRDGEKRDFLTRLDRREREDAYRLLIVSPREPVRPKGWPAPPDAWLTREITPAFFAFRQYRFQLRANPTKRENASRKRLPLRTPQEQGDWLRRKAAAAGFAVDAGSLRIIPEGREWFTKPGHQGLHHAVEYEGLLAVTDPPVFRDAFTKGFGSAKAFGFGLLALAPVAGGED